VFAGVARIWPKDVGASPEEHGEHVDFLSVTIHTSPDGTFTVSPLIKNLNFAKGFVKFPDVSRIPPYAGPSIHNFLVLQRILFPHFITFNRISRGHISTAAPAAACLLAETGRCGWPTRLVSQVVASIPIKFETMFVISLRKLAKYIRKHIPDNKPDFLNFVFFKWFFNAYISDEFKRNPDMLMNDPIVAVGSNSTCRPTSLFQRSC
jgi:hypothetical protein